MGWSGKGVDAGSALFTTFCDTGGFGNLGDYVVPTVRGASRDVVKVYAC